MYLIGGAFFSFHSLFSPPFYTLSVFYTFSFCSCFFLFFFSFSGASCLHFFYFLLYVSISSLMSPPFRLFPLCYPLFFVYLYQDPFSILSVCFPVYSHPSLTFFFLSWCRFFLLVFILRIFSFLFFILLSLLFFLISISLFSFRLALLFCFSCFYYRLCISLMLSFVFFDFFFFILLRCLVICSQPLFFCILRS